MSTTEIVDAVTEINLRLLKVHSVLFYKKNAFEFKFQAPAIVDAELKVTSNIIFDKERQITIPDRVIIVKKLIKNCADTNLTSTVGITIRATKGWRATKTRTLATTLGVKVSGSYGVTGVGSVSGDISWNQTLTLTDSEEKSESLETTITVNDMLSIKPYSALDVEASATQYGIEVPFTIQVEVDGNCALPGGYHAEPAYRVSQFLNPQERTITMTGILRVEDVSAYALHVKELIGEMACPKPPKTADTDQKTIEIPLAMIPKERLEKFVPPSELDPQFLDHPEPMLFQNILENGYKLVELDDAHGDGPTIGPPDGESYEILYTTTEARYALECGINDIGLPNPGIFEIEHRRYSEYAGGKLVRQWEASQEKFLNCMTV